MDPYKQDKHGRTSGKTWGHSWWFWHPSRCCGSPRHQGWAGLRRAERHRKGKRENSITRLFCYLLIAAKLWLVSQGSKGSLDKHEEPRVFFKMIDKAPWRIKNECGQSHSFYHAHSVFLPACLARKTKALPSIRLALATLGMLLWRCSFFPAPLDVSGLTSVSHKNWAKGNTVVCGKSGLFDAASANVSWINLLFFLCLLILHIFDVQTIFFIVKIQEHIVACQVLGVKSCCCTV